jgi:hypothetical protein
MKEWHGTKGTSLEISGPGPRLSKGSRRCGHAMKADGEEPRWWTAAIPKETRPEEAMTGKHGKS